MTVEKYQDAIKKLVIFAQEQDNQVNFSEIEWLVDPKDISKATSELDKLGIEVIMEDVEPEKNNPIVVPFDTAKIDISMKQMSIDSLVKRIKHNELDFDSDFQRKSGLWQDYAKSRLIESILLRIPLPAFYFDAAKEDFWTIIDGLQRMTVFKEFIVDGSLALTDMEFLQEQNGKKFLELPRGLQRRIEETNVIAYIVNPSTPTNVKFNIFKRINTGGLVLTAQEIRNALYQGAATQFIKKLSEESLFKEVTGGSIRSARMLDREFCLRFVAITCLDLKDYTSIEDFLNLGMNYLNLASNEELDRIKKSFLRMLQVAEKLFGIYAFRKMAYDGRRRPINKAIFEIWSYQINKLTDEEVNRLIQMNDELTEEFIQLCEDSTFLNNIKSSDRISVKRRILMVESLIKELIHVD